MGYFYRFAGMEFEVTMPEQLYYTEHRNLAAFLTDRVTDPHRFSYALTASLPEPQGRCIAQDPAYRVFQDGECRLHYIGAVENSLEGAYMLARHQGKDHQVLVKESQIRGRLGTHTVLTAMQPEHLIAQVGGFILHASYVAHDGSGILFTAPSGTGKSTQAELWKKYRGAEIVNGDRTAVRITEQGVLAEGIPFSGSSSYCENRSLPLKAIVYLQQAPENRVTKMSGLGAFRKVWEGCSVNTWDAEDIRKVSGTVEQVIGTVPVYLLQCTPDENAVIALEQALRE